MGYEIIYNTFTVKRNGKYIPMVVMGSNNCYEVYYDTKGRERERRERNLYKASSFFDNNGEFEDLENMDKHFKSELVNKEMDGGMLQGRYTTPKGVLNSFKKYLVDSVPVTPQFCSLYYFDDVSDDKKKEIRKIFKNEIKERVPFGEDEVLTKEEEMKIVDDSLDKLEDEVKDNLLEWRRKDHLLYYPCDKQIEDL